MTVYYGPVAYIQLKGKNDEDVHVLYFYVPTNFLNKQFFVEGHVLCQLPKTGAGTWLNASIKNLGKYSKTAAGMSFKKKKQLFSTCNFSRNPMEGFPSSKYCFVTLTKLPM